MEDYEMDCAKLKIVCFPSCSFCIMYRKKASLACKQTLVKYHFHERNKLKSFSKSLEKEKNKIKFAGKKEINRNSEEERENLRRKNFKLLKNNKSNDWIIWNVIKFF